MSESVTGKPNIIIGTPDDRVSSGPYTVLAAGPEADLTVVEHWRDLWLEVGVPQAQLRPDFRVRTLRFIAEARDRLRYQTFVAVDSDQTIVGSASCQQWEGPFPMIAASPLLDLGTVWCIFVRPQHRRRGLGTRLVASCVEHWKAIGCTRGILMYASELGRRIYEKAGFAPGNVLMLDDLRGGGQSPKMEFGATCRTTPQAL
jgi:GNAT superfamily N-acetyltransferase